MEEKILKSNIIKSVSYYGRTMFINMKDGRLFSYNSVPRDLFDEFVNTSSHDEFFTKNIVPKFSFQRMA